MGPSVGRAVQLHADHGKNEPVLILLGDRLFLPWSIVPRLALHRQFGEEYVAEVRQFDHVAEGFPRRSGHPVDQGAADLVLTLRRSRIPIKLIACPLGKASHALDVGILMRDAAEDAPIVEIGLVAVRFGTKNFEVGLKLDLLSADAEILEARAQKAHRRYTAVVRVLGGDLRHYAVGSEHVKQ